MLMFVKNAVKMLIGLYGVALKKSNNVKLREYMYNN